MSKTTKKSKSNGSIPGFKPMKPLSRSRKASQVSSPKSPVPSDTYCGLHRQLDTQDPNGAAGQPKAALKPILEVAGHPSNGIHVCGETQTAAGAVADETISHVKPKESLSRRRKSNGTQISIDTQRNRGAVEDGGETTVAVQSNKGLSSTILNIRDKWRARRAWHRAEKSLTLQASAICRRFVEGNDKARAGRLLKQIEKEDPSAPTVAYLLCQPLLQGREPIRKYRKAIEKELESEAGKLPMAEWAAKVRGFALPSLAAIVGECGDLSNYATVSRLWKRMGLAVIEGERQRRVGGDMALIHGYNPERRSVIWNIGECLIKAQEEGDPYRTFYLAEKERQLAKGMTRIHAHRRAARHMTKKFLADLHSVWRQQEGVATPVVKPIRAVPPHQSTEPVAPKSL